MQVQELFVWDQWILDEERVFVFDASSLVFVWVGRSSPAKERDLVRFVGLGRGLEPTVVIYFTLSSTCDFCPTRQAYYFNYCTCRDFVFFRRLCF